ncbi:MAG: methionine gamma-lyase family protein [Oscillospiraceae bacterium]|jgi:cystathionine beta-lyase family protein involved in aluminum resistance|nr:methionine gamma-lyase family protein [Oscillospiraceae bacterium]
MFFNFSEFLLKKAELAEEMCSAAFKRFDETARHNGEKVLKAFIDNRVSERHLCSATGYGYGDEGRDVLDEVFAEAFGAEKALVRHNFVNGTHAVTTALFGVLRMGDRLISATGEPYDTLKGVMKGDSGGSLREYGIEYAEVKPLSDGSPDLKAVRRYAEDCEAVFIQRSRGYGLRPSVTVEKIGAIVKTVREVNPNAVVITDNCYGEFCEKTEPLSVGADLIVGSLIKNPGGGIAETGGYIAGKSDLVELCAYRLTAPGIGAKAGCSLNQNRSMYAGLFRAPETVAAALKTSAFALALMKLLGYECVPDYDEYRTDITSAVKLGGERELRAFCEGIQAGSPVDSHATPQPWDMPGYQNKIIMASGAFNPGSSIELSADAPLREPWAVWLQGGLTFAAGRIGVMTAAQRLLSLKN